MTEESTRIGRILVVERGRVEKVRSRSARGTYHAQAAKAGNARRRILTVREGYVYDTRAADSPYPGARERAAAIHAELGDGPLAGIEGRLAYRAAKRAFDVAFSAGVLVALGPLLLAVAAAIKVDDPEGPALFKQERVGKDGRTFTMYKFRSMVADAEARLAEVAHLNEKDGPVFKIANDPRITRVGRIIRKTSIDELPQFINVLRGDMSVVGPRPALPAEVAKYSDYQRQRLLVKPGITCYWQTRMNRDTISFDEWVDLDLLYIRKCGIWSDLKLIIQTVGVVLTAQGS